MTDVAQVAPARLTALELASVGASIAALGISRVGFNIVGNHVLGLDAVGLANVCLSVALLIGLPVSAGLAAAISRFVPLLSSASDAPRTLRIAIAWSLACLVVGLVVALPLLRATSSLAATPVALTVIAAWTGLYAVYAVGRARLFAERRTHLALALELSALGAFAAGLLAASAAHELWWLPFGLYPLPMVAGLLWSLARPAPRGAVPLPAGFLRFAAWAFAGSAASLGIQYGSTLVAGAHGGAGHAGIWATLSSLAAPVLLLPRSLSTVFLPRLSRLSAGPRAAFADARAEHGRVASVIAFPATALPMLAGPLLLPVVLGRRVEPEVAMAWIVVCVTTYVICRKEPAITAIAARGHAGVNAAAAFGAASVCALVWVAAPPFAGELPALALGLLVQAFAAPAIATALVRRREPGDAVARPSLVRGDVGIMVAVVCSLLGRETPVVIPAGVLAVVALSALDVRRLRGGW